MHACCLLVFHKVYCFVPQFWLFIYCRFDLIHVVWSVFYCWALCLSFCPGGRALLASYVCRSESFVARFTLLWVARMFGGHDVVLFKLTPVVCLVWLLLPGLIDSHTWLVFILYFNCVCFLLLDARWFILLIVQFCCPTCVFMCIVKRLCFCSSFCGYVRPVCLFGRTRALFVACRSFVRWFVVRCHSIVRWLVCVIKLVSSLDSCLFVRRLSFRVSLYCCFGVLVFCCLLFCCIWCFIVSLFVVLLFGYFAVRCFVVSSFLVVLFCCVVVWLSFFVVLLSRRFVALLLCIVCLCLLFCCLLCGWLVVRCFVVSLLSCCLVVRCFVGFV